MHSTRVLTSMCLALLASMSAAATQINLSGLFPNKALVQIDGGPLQTLAIGEKTKQGVVLVSVEGDAATFEIDGRLVKIAMGHGRMTSTGSADVARLTADPRGHFFTDGQINGQSIRFIVDTGATLVVLPSSEARRLGIDYQKGTRSMMQTANGRATAYRIKLDTVSVGGVTLHGVDAAVSEGPAGFEPLLGMSFLNRTDMKREGDIMTLTKRY